MANRRSAEYVSTLVYLDEPQLILLRAHKTIVVAMAIPSSDERADFIAASISKKSWQEYIDGNVDLRYLFTFAERSIYKFNLMDMKDSRIMLVPWEGDVSDRYLPEPRFFSRSHTEDESDESIDAPGEEQMIVDGEWDMPDFGSFYGRYADVYYFLSSANELEDIETTHEKKAYIEDAFRHKAFRGGFSYVHFYQALASHRARGERISIDKIKYESPGYLKIHGNSSAFGEIRHLVRSFLETYKETKKQYDEFYSYMSKARLLTLAGHEFSDKNLFSEPLRKRSIALAEAIGVPNQDAIAKAVDNNMLVFAKIILSFYRRLEETSKFFAQGRMNFT